MGPDIRIFPISAKLGLQAKLNGSSEDLAASGLPVFSEALDRFLVKEKGKVLIESVSRNLHKVLSRARLETELELKSLGTPVEQIRQKIAAFERRKEELIRGEALIRCPFQRRDRAPHHKGTGPGDRRSEGQARLGDGRGVQPVLRIEKGPLPKRAQRRTRKVRSG